METQTDILIIGAGPAGAAAASWLARRGVETTVLERDTFPRFVIGESLLPRCMDLLDEAGLLEAVEAQGYIVKHGASILRSEESCTFDFGQGYTEGWGHTHQVKRDHFDKVIIDAASDAGATVNYGCNITDLSFDDAGVSASYTDADGTAQTLNANFVLDASGPGRVVARSLGLVEPSEFPSRTAIFTHVEGDIRPTGQDEGKIWVCIHDQDTWIWIIPFSDGTTSIGVVAEQTLLDSRGATDEERLWNIVRGESNAAARLKDATATRQIRRIDGYASGVSRLSGDHYALLGNAAEFLDPVFSSGVTLALESSLHACRLLMRERDGESIDWETDFDGYIARGVDVFRTYVKAWYDGRLPEIFFSADQNPEFKAKICSVLAGYVWDESNPFVAQHERGIRSLSALLAGRKAVAEAN